MWLNQTMQKLINQIIMVKFSALPGELGNICKIISKINRTEKIAPKHIKNIYLLAKLIQV